MNRIVRIIVFTAFSLLLPAGLLFSTLDYRGNYPYISYAHFSKYFDNPIKAYLVFHKDILTSYAYDFTRGVRPLKGGARVQFDLIDPDHPAAVEFRRLNNLDAAVAPANTELEKMLRLREWTHARVWPLTLSPIPFSMSQEGKSGFTLLRRSRQNARMLCGEAAALFVQAAGSAGIVAREVMGHGHITAEAWSSAHKKWVVMDPLYNAHYEKDGVPLSFMELMKIFYAAGKPEPAAYHQQLGKFIDQSEGRSEEIFQKALGVIRGFYEREGVALRGGPRGLPTPMPPQKMKDILVGAGIGDMTPSAFADFAVALRNDYLIHQYPIWHLRNYNHMWNYLYWLGDSRKPPAQAYQVSNDVNDFYWEPRLPQTARKP